MTELWRMPQSYAEFLGQELSLIYRGAVLVVMPNGFGLYRSGPLSRAERSALAQLELPRGELGSAALAAVERLARASGHPLPETSTGVPTKSGGTDTVAWIVFALGAALIVLAWTASLRARPPRLGRAHH